MGIEQIGLSPNPHGLVLPDRGRLMQAEGGRRGARAIGNEKPRIHSAVRLGRKGDLLPQIMLQLRFFEDLEVKGCLMVNGGKRPHYLLNTPEGVIARRMNCPCADYQHSESGKKSAHVSIYQPGRTTFERQATENRLIFHGVKRSSSRFSTIRRNCRNILTYRQHAVLMNPIDSDKYV